MLKSNKSQNLHRIRRDETASSSTNQLHREAPRDAVAEERTWDSVQNVQNVEVRPLVGPSSVLSYYKRFVDFVKHRK